MTNFYSPALHYKITRLNSPDPLANLTELLVNFQKTAPYYEIEDGRFFLTLVYNDKIGSMRKEFFTQ